MVWWVLTDSCVAGGQIPGDTCKKWRADWRVQREAYLSLAFTLL